MGEDNLSVQLVQRKMSLMKVHIWNVVKVVRYLRNIISQMFEFMANTTIFQKTTANGIVELSNVILIQQKQIQDLNARLDRIDGGTGK